MSEVTAKSQRTFPHLWRGLLRFGLALLIVAGLFYGIVYFTFGRSLRKATEPVTDFSRYAEIVERETRNGGISRLLQHLPESRIIEAASDKRLFYRPKFLQGGGCFHLKLQLPPAIFATELDRLRSMKVETAPADTTWASDYFSSSSHSALTDNHEVWSIIPQPKTTAPWRNHGEDAGIAIARSTGEIIYWSEWW